MVVISFMSIDDRKVKERFKELGTGRAGRNSDQAPAAAERRGNGTEPSVAQRQAAGPGNEIARDR